MPGRYHDVQEALDSWNALKKEAGVEKLLMVSLVSDKEIIKKSPDFAKSIRAGLWEGERVSFPIEDFGLPEDEIAFALMIQKVAATLRTGMNVVIHCAAGIGRTGMAAVCTLASLGVPIKEAYRTVRAAGSAPETAEQQALVTRLFGQKSTS